MNIHEYQAKALLREFSVPVAAGEVAESADEAVAAAQRIGNGPWVIKAQIHAGGRGKGGGVKLAHSLDEVRTIADNMLGMILVTPQTGPQGRLVRKVYVEAASQIARELYLSCLIDRRRQHFAFIASTEGGMDIEQVAASQPDKVVTVDVDPAAGFSGFHGRKLAQALGLEGAAAKQCARLAEQLLAFFQKYDASLDAKLNFDDNGLFRHKEIAALRDIAEEDPAEVEASKFGLNYIKLDGTIGCMVNGAGLAMATMDIIKLYGAEPANFLDVGGGASKEQVENAFRIILSDEHVRGILVNIFGGIMRCDIIAEGIVAAARTMAITVPLVVRLEGTNVQLGKQILADSGLKIIPADDLADAAEKITGAVRAA